MLVISLYIYYLCKYIYKQRKTLKGHITSGNSFHSSLYLKHFLILKKYFYKIFLHLIFLDRKEKNMKEISILELSGCLSIMYINLNNTFFLIIAFQLAVLLSQRCPSVAVVTNE